MEMHLVWRDCRSGDSEESPVDEDKGREQEGRKEPITRKANPERYFIPRYCDFL